MHRILGIAAVGALAASGLALSSPTEAATSHAPGRLATSVTSFSLAANAYGTKVSGGDVSVNSGRTAYSAIGCTRTAGLDQQNHVAGVRLDRLADAQAVRSHTWTTRANGVVAAHSTTVIAKLTVGRNVTIDTIKASTRSWHDASGFHSRATTSVADITGPGGTDLGLPTAGHPIVIPGVARISIGSSQRDHNRNFAGAQAVALKITVIPTGTKILAGFASSRIDGDVTGGLFHGFANGSQVHLLGRTATSGRTSLLPIPCPGTRGVTKTTSTARASSLGASLSGLQSSVYGVQYRKSADGFTRAKVLKTTLFNHRLKISGAVARANVTLHSDGTHLRTDNGTTLGGIFLNGTRLRVGADGVVRVRDLALIHTDVVNKTKAGIDVVAVRIKLLSGARAGSVIDLAHATLSIKSR